MVGGEMRCTAPEAKTADIATSKNSLVSFVIVFLPLLSWTEFEARAAPRRGLYVRSVEKERLSATSSQLTNSAQIELSDTRRTHALQEARRSRSRPVVVRVHDLPIRRSVG